MELKPGCKQTELGVIPTDWEVRRIGEIASVKGGKRLPLGRSLVSKETSHPYLRVTDMRHGGVDLSDIKYVPEDVFPAIKNYRIFCEDIFISVAGTLGIVGKIPVELDGANLTENADKITGITCVRDFMLYNLMSDRIQAIIDSEKTVGAQPKLALGRIASFAVALPPANEEQHAIATALSDVDALIGALDRLIAKKRDLKQATMQQLLTGQTRLPGFIGEWGLKTFGEIFGYLSTATNSRSDLTSEGDTYYIHYGDIHTKFHGHLDFSKDKPPMIDRARCNNAALLQNGDWVMADASEDFAGVGKSIEISGLEDSMSAVSGLHTFLLREKVQTFEPEFKGHLGNLKSIHEQFLRVATGMKVFGVSKAALKDLELPVPGPEEQTAIATILSDMDAEIPALEARRDKTRALKQGMMQELLTGRIRLV